MARLTNEEWESLEADYHTGIYSKNELAKKYDVTHTAVNKRLRGIEPKFQQLVSSQIAINTELQSQSFKQVSAIETAVSESMRRATLVYSIQEKALAKAEIMLDQIDSPSDLKTIVDAVDKASVTLKVSDRHAKNTEVNISNTNAQQNIMQNKSLDDFYEE